MKSTRLIAMLALGCATASVFAAAPAPAGDKVAAARVSAALNARVPAPAGFTAIKPQQGVSQATTPVAGANGQMSQVLNAAASSAQTSK
ncbi:hypothetical protein G3A43_06400 [Paraburkholderia aspalathi]|nr:hypothetical protein [Paraburkholderia aspalathi]MBK3779879.1 hypothetical protein [Paraburkholderia aspalathi]